MALGSLVVLAVAAWLAVPWLVRTYALRRLERRLGITLEAGDIEAGFGSLRLRDVRVRSLDTGLPLATISSLVVDVDPWAVLRGRIGVRRIVMTRPVVLIAVTGDAEWREVVGIVRRVFRTGGRLGTGGAGPVVEAVDAEFELAWGDDLAVRVEMPSVRLGPGSQVRFEARDLWIGTRGEEVASASSFEGIVRLSRGVVRIESAVVRGGSARWSRSEGEPARATAAWRVVAALRRLVAAGRGEGGGPAPGRPAAPVSAAAPAAARPAAGAGSPACAVPFEGTLRLEGASLSVRDGALAGGEELASGGIVAEVGVAECGGRAGISASGDGGSGGEGWDVRATLANGALDGAGRLSQAAIERLQARLRPDFGLPESGAPVAVLASRAPGADVLVVSGAVPVPAIGVSAAGWSARMESGRADCSLRLGPVAEDRIGFSGEILLPAIDVEGPAGARRFAGPVVRLDSGTAFAPGSSTATLVARVDAGAVETVGISSDPPIVVSEPSLRLDLSFGLGKGARREVSGSVDVGGLTLLRGDGTGGVVALAGTFERGTWFDAGGRTAHVTGRILADGVEIDRRRFPFVKLGPPGTGLDVDVAPGERDGVWIVDGTISVGGVTIDSRSIARSPIEGFAFDASGTFTVDLDGGEATFERGHVRVGAVETAASGSLAVRDGVPAFRLAAAGTHVRCQDLLDAIPPALRSDLPGLEFSGNADFHVALDIDFADLRSTVFDLDADSRCRVVAADDAVDMDRLHGTFRHEVLLPGGRRRTIVTGPGSPEWTPIEEISRYMTAAVIATEDARFLEHSGVSIADLRTAIIRDLREGRFVYGGSTIDMQVVKNVFLDREKTLARKLQEVILSWWMDQALGKDQILELYLNVIEYGPNIYGIREAAMRYFGRTPADLSPLEAVFLAKLLPNPVARHRMYLSGVVPPGWRARLDRVMGIMAGQGVLSEWEFEAAVHDEIRFHHPGEPLPAPRYGQGSGGVEGGEPAPDAGAYPLSVEYPWSPGPGEALEELEEQSPGEVW